MAGATGKIWGNLITPQWSNPRYDGNLLATTQWPKACITLQLLVRCYVCLFQELLGEFCILTFELRLTNWPSNAAAKTMIKECHWNFKRNLHSQKKKKKLLSTVSQGNGTTCNAVESRLRRTPGGMPSSVFSERALKTLRTHLLSVQKHSGDRIALKLMFAQCCKSVIVIIYLRSAALAWCVRFSLKIDLVIICNALTELELLDCASGVYAIYILSRVQKCSRGQFNSLTSLDRRLFLAHPQEDHFVVRIVV